MDYEGIIIVFLVVVMPLWLLLHYVFRWKNSKGLSEDDSRLLEEIWERANAMEQRVMTLETILDAESPQWRSHYESITSEPEKSL